MKKNILIIAGGDSPEHEVSIITALQALENLDQSIFEPFLIYQDKNLNWYWLKNLKSKKDFFKSKRIEVTFGKDSKGGFVLVNNLLKRKIYAYSAINAMHGGVGESGGLAGLFEINSIPFSSTDIESSALVMNKSLTKLLVSQVGVAIVESITIESTDIQKNSQENVKEILEKIQLPLIVKPVHLGSSIGIKVCRNEMELEKALLESSFVDREVLVEKLVHNFKEYNCAVFRHGAKLLISEIEKPLGKDEILSFEDKYKNGAKKSSGGMSSLQRELPAKISSDLRDKIEENARKAYQACKCKGMVRIDFMLDGEDNLYLTEINPVPGSLSFYLWEGTGISFTELLTMLVEQAVVDYEHRKTQRITYDSGDIVKRFIDQK